MPGNLSCYGDYLSTIHWIAIALSVKIDQPVHVSPYWTRVLNSEIFVS